MAYKSKEAQRAACRDHYQRNKAAYLERNARRLDEFRAVIKKAKAVPCADCGIQYPHYVMQFDHLRDKSFTIANITKVSSMSSLLAEIEKCEVVCANCHHERTWRRIAERGVGSAA